MAKNRRIEYVLAAVNDPGSKKAFDEHTANIKAVEAAEKSAAKAAGEARAAMTKGMSATGGRTMSAAGGSAVNAAATPSGAIARSVRETETAVRREQKILADRVRAHVDASKAIREAARSTLSTNYQNRQATAAAAAPKALTDKDFKKHTESLGKQYAEVEKLERQRMALSSKAWKDTGTAVVTATHGLIQYGRAIALLSAADEESAQRALQKIARFQAFADVLTGTIQIVKAGTTAWRAYQAAAAAAATTSALAGRAGAGATIAGGGARAAGGTLIGAGGSALLGAGGGAAAVAAGAVAAKAALVAAAGASLAGIVIFGGAAIKAAIEGKNIKEELKRTGSDLVEGFTELTGLSDKAGDAAKAWKERWKSVGQQMDDGMKLADIRIAGKNAERAAVRDMEVNRAGYKLNAFNSNREDMISGKEKASQPTYSVELAEAKKRRELAQQNFEADRRALELADKNTSVGGIAQRHEALGTLKAATPEVIESHRQVLAVEQQIKQQQIEGARAALAGLHDRRTELSKLVEDEKQAARSAAARFGALNAGEQQRTLAAFRKHQAGGALDREESGLLGGLGGSGSDIANEHLTNIANKNGFQEIHRGIYQPKIDVPTKAVGDVIANITNQVDAVIKMELDSNTLTADFKRTVDPLMKLAVAQAKDEIKRALQQLEMERVHREATNDF